MEKNAYYDLHLNTVRGWASLVEYHDPDAAGHLQRISTYTEIIARKMARRKTYRSYLSDSYIRDLTLASVLHDIGKAGVSHEILYKPDLLSKDEFDQVKKHVTIGGDFIDGLRQSWSAEFPGSRSYLEMGAQVARYHHERWDGHGYSQSLCGSEIPLSARIVSVADVYDALTSSRSYKEAWSHRCAAAEIQSGAGTQFDPDVVEAFAAAEHEIMIAANMQ